MMAMLKMGFRAGGAAGLAVDWSLTCSFARADVSGFGMVWGLLNAGSFQSVRVGIRPKGENARHLQSTAQRAATVADARQVDPGG
jgi:hypothetical protein